MRLLCVCVWACLLFEVELYQGNIMLYAFVTEEDFWVDFDLMMTLSMTD
jgi:hypothetical protein